jgi:hypothetical protein
MNNFDKNWRNAKKSIFRLEGRAEYHIPGDWENFEEWKTGDFDLAKNKYWQNWLKTLKSAQKKKIAVQRVKVTPEPLPDYVKYELDLWQKYSVANGEEIFFLSANNYQAITKEAGFDPKDFWFFDDQALLMFNYDKSGKPAGEILITNGGMINRYVELKQKLLQKSLPMETFLKKIAKIPA